MTVSQPKEWNLLLRPPMSWSERRQLLKMMLPPIMFVFVTASEMVFLHIWMSDAPREKWPIILMLPLGMVGFLFLVGAIAGQVESRSKRTLKLKKHAVWIQPARQARIGWKRVLEWQFEPFPDARGACKVTLIYTFDRKHKRRWTLLLQNPDREALFGELAVRKQNGARFQITELDEPSIVQTSRPKSVPGLWLVVAGWFLLLHSIGPLVIGLGVKGSPDAASRPPSRNVQKFVERHVPRFFKTVEELRQFYLRVGVTLASSGVLLTIWGFTRANGSNERTSGPDSELPVGQARTRSV